MTRFAGDAALRRAERDGYLIDPSYRQVLWPWWMQRCIQTRRPFIAGCAKHRYAIVEVDLDPCFPRQFTREGGAALLALAREYSRGMKHWSASGGRYHWFCQKIPKERIETLVREVHQAIDGWTVVINEPWDRYHPFGPIRASHEG